MSRITRTASLRLAAAAALAVGVSACDITVGAAEFKVREEKRFTVQSGSTVKLSTFDGSIEIRGWDRPEVLIEIEKQGTDQQATDAIKVSATQDGATVTVDIPKPLGLPSTHFGRSPSARIVASIPIQTDLVVRSGDGSMSVTRVSGKLDLRTEDGSLTLKETTGSLLARTGDGSFHGDGVDGSIDAQTGDGSIDLEGVVRGVRLATEDGSIRIAARKGSAADEDWTISTGDGSIDVALPGGFSAEVDAQSGDGHVSVEGLAKQVGSQEANADRESHQHEQRHVKGSLGAGGRLLKLRSGNGAIDVR